MTSREYMDDVLLLPLLGCALEQLLRAQTAASEKGASIDPINFLATWLMRNNPRAHPESVPNLEALRGQHTARNADEELMAATAGDVTEAMAEAVDGDSSAFARVHAQQSILCRNQSVACACDRLFRDLFWPLPRTGRV